MLNFVAKRFRTFIVISLWINLIFWPIFLGFMLGGHRTIYDGSSIREFSAGGFFLGLVVGILTDIIFGGLVAVFLSIDKGIKNMNKWLQFIWQHRINTDANQKIRLTPIDDDDIYYFDGLEVSPQAVGNSSNSLSDSLLS